MSLVVCVVAPTGRDAELIATLLERNGIPSAVDGIPAAAFTNPEHEPIGPLLIAEEALDRELIHKLSLLIERQPPWSDLPILILTRNEKEIGPSERRQREWLPLGFPILLERPIRPATLVSSVRAALRARVRQYEIRDTVALLKQQRETLQVVLDNLPVGVVVAKVTGEIVLGNRQLETIVRHPLLPTPDIESHGNWTAYHPDGRRVRGEEFPLPRAMKAKRVLPAEHFLYERGDGTKAWVSLAAAPIFDDQGEVTGGVLTIADIDHHKRAESALIQSEKLAAVGRMAASISHEINNPLEAVTNLLYLTKQSDLLDEATRGYLELADQELGRVSQIVSHTLRFHRQATKPRAISAEELLEPTLGLYAARLANAHIELSVRHKATDLVVCYEGEIRQVLNNLVGNAAEAMRTGGRLTVRTRNARAWADGARGIQITIADSGHGMTSEVAKRIFEPFFTTKGLNGTGLGLWISQGIVMKHNGRLRVRSGTRPGRSGTVFSLFLPLEAPLAPPASEGATI